MRTRCFSVFKTKAGNTFSLERQNTSCQGLVQAGCDTFLFLTNAKKNMVLVDDSQSSNDITQHFNIHKSPIPNKTSLDFPLLT